MRMMRNHSPKLPFPKRTAHPSPKKIWMVSNRGKHRKAEVGRLMIKRKKNSDVEWSCLCTVQKSYFVKHGAVGKKHINVLAEYAPLMQHKSKTKSFYHVKVWFILQGYVILSLIKCIRLVLIKSLSLVLIKDSFCSNNAECNTIILNNTTVWATLSHWNIPAFESVPILFLFFRAAWFYAVLSILHYWFSLCSWCMPSGWKHIRVPHINHI